MSRYSKGSDFDSVIYLVSDNPEKVRFAELNFQKNYSKIVWFCNIKLLLAHEFQITPACIVIYAQEVNYVDFNIIRSLDEKGVTIPIIFISETPSISMSVRAIKKGAYDYLSKPLSSFMLLKSVKLALDFSRQNLKLLREQSVIVRRLRTLTPRESEVLKFVTAGLMNKQIAAAMGISEITVKVHRRRIKEKLNVYTVAGLVKCVEYMKKTGQPYADIAE